jgi:hypothetical protein
MVLSACGAFPGGNSRAGGSAGGTSGASGGSAGAATVESQAGQRDTGAAGAQEQAGAPATGQAGAGTSGSSAGGSAASGGAAGAAATAGAAGDQPVGDSIVNVTFDQLPLGKYSLAQVASEWGGTPRWENGLADGRADIVGGSDAYSGHSLRVTYPANVFGPEGGGVQFIVPLPKSYSELYCSYRVRFDVDFEFVKGGKLPGLSGGTSDTGGTKPDGSDGWSARMMWRDTDGKAVQYVYYPDQASSYADDFPWTASGQDRFGKGQWHTVEHHIVMNTPGNHDGLVEGYFDGKLALQHRALRFRDTLKFGIDDFYFSTFYGGSTQDWAPTAVHHAFFDDFVIASHPLH